MNIALFLILQSAQAETEGAPQETAPQPQMTKSWIFQGNWHAQNAFLKESSTTLPSQHILNQTSLSWKLGWQQHQMRILNHMHYQLTMIHTYNTESTEKNQLGVLNLAQDILYLHPTSSPAINLLIGMGWECNLPIATHSSNLFSETEQAAYDDQMRSLKATIRSFGLNIPIGIEYHWNQDFYSGFQVDNRYYLSIYPTNHERIWTSNILQLPQIFMGFQW